MSATINFTTIIMIHTFSKYNTHKHNLPDRSQSSNVVPDRSSQQMLSYIATTHNSMLL